MLIQKVKSKEKKAIVIGAGVAGLAASIRLRAQGFEVSVYERNAFPGGKLSEIVLGNYRFDAGPSLFTMPHLVEELFWISGKPSREFEYEKLQEVCRYFFADGTKFTASGHRETLIREMANTFQILPLKIQNYLDTSAFKYETIGKLFLERCLRKPLTFFNQRAFKAYLNLPKLGLFSSLASYHASVAHNPNLNQLLNRYATYNGSDPYQTPAVMSMIPHLEFGIGAFFPKGGMHQITQSLFELAKSLGVQFHFSASVNSILADGKRVRGIEVDGKEIEGDTVLSAIDVSQTYERLLKQKKVGQHYAQLPKSTSAIIWYWGIKRSFPELGLHNIFFSKNYREEFRDLFDRKKPPADPTIYVNISAKHKADDAPEGGENWFVMINVPANTGQNWAEEIPKLRQIVLDRLSAEMGVNIESLIEEETFLSPLELEKRTGALGGALYGSNSNSQFAAFLRHANYSSAYSNLFFCGGTVHPGGGIPLALQSAAIACQYVKERFKNA